VNDVVEQALMHTRRPRTVPGTVFDFFGLLVRLLILSPPIYPSFVLQTTSTAASLASYVSESLEEYIFNQLLDSC